MQRAPLAASACSGRSPRCALLLAVNAVFNPGFWQLQWRDGHLYGSLIDILNRAAPLALVALGMTLVIATRGIDISVGAVVAIARRGRRADDRRRARRQGRRAESRQPRFRWPSRSSPRWPRRRCAALWNGLLVARVGMQPIIATLILMVAGRGIAQLLTGGQIITDRTTRRTSTSATASCSACRLRCSSRGAVWLARARCSLSRTALGLFIAAIGINPARGARGGRARAADHGLRLRVLRPVAAGVAGLVISSNVKSADGNNAGAADGARRDPGRDARRHRC